MLIGVVVSCAGGIVGGAGGVARGQTFATGIVAGNLQNGSIDEASGIVASRLNTNVLWTHNDSGNSAQLFAMTTAGASLATYSLTGTSNFDWEDIATGPGPTAGTNYLFVGDIGDNLAIRSSVTVYRVPEPTVSDTQSPPVTAALGGAVALTFAYPNGRRDAESLFVDPLSGDLYIISKRDAQKYVYRAPYPQSTSGTTTMQLVATLNNANWITGADISVDGNRIIMKAPETGSGLMYTRPAGGTIADAFATTPVAVPLLSETQGEAIAFDPLGRGYYTTSEGAGAPVHYFDRLAPPAAGMYWDNDGVAAGSRSTTGVGLGGTGTWNAPATKWYNGSADVPWQNGHNAVFWGTAGTVTLGAAQTVNSLSFKTTGYTLAGSTLTLAGSSVSVDAGVVATISSTLAGAAGLVKSGGGTLRLAGANTFAGGTTVSAGTLVATNGDALAGGALGVANGATVQAQPGLVKALTLTILTTAGTGKLDLTNNSAVIRNMTLAAVRAAIASGFAGGAWTGGGITSSTAAGNPGTAIGFASNGVLSKSSFEGVSGLTASDVLVRYTDFGDADLSGTTTLDDFTLFLNGYQNAGTTWVQGDFDYNGVVTLDDFTLFLAGYQQQGAPLSELEAVVDSVPMTPAERSAMLAAVAAAVPEPSGLAVLGALAGAALTRRRRRRRHTVAVCEMS
jgi:autotransporter-associated beta strand protein